MKVATHVTTTAALWGGASLASVLILGLFDPSQASNSLLIVLYSVAFIWVFSSSLLIGYFLRIALWRSGVRYELWRSSRRQAMLFGFFSVILLLLERAGVFNPLTAVLLLVIFVLMELYSSQ